MKRKLSNFKNRIRVFLACGLYLAAGMLPQRLRKSFFGKTRVLVFHHIDDAARFRAIVLALKKRYNFISFEQYLRHEKAFDRINVIIALDDGYRSWHQNALPVFQEFKIKPVLFVNSDFIGKSELEAENYCRNSITTWPEASLNWTELMELASAGSEIGGHTRGHINLSTPSNSAQMLDSISSDRRVIENKLKQNVRIFAYPFGLYSKHCVEVVAQAQYEYAFTSDSGFLEDSPGPLLLKRSNIGLRPPLVVCAMMEGWPDRISAIVRVLKGNG